MMLTKQLKTFIMLTKQLKRLLLTDPKFLIGDTTLNFSGNFLQNFNLKLAPENP